MQSSNGSLPKPYTMHLATAIPYSFSFMTGGILLKCFFNIQGHTLFVGFRMGWSDIMTLLTQAFMKIFQRSKLKQVYFIGECELTPSYGANIWFLHSSTSLLTISTYFLALTPNHAPGWCWSYSRREKKATS